jgi:hypothetical protein
VAFFLLCYAAQCTYTYTYNLHLLCESAWQRRGSLTVLVWYQTVYGEVLLSILLRRYFFHFVKVSVETCMRLDKGRKKRENILVFIPVLEVNPANMRTSILTFRGPCIVIYSYNESQREVLFLKFI